MRRRFWMQGLLFVGLVMLSYGFFENSFTKDYVSVIENISVSSVDKNDPLYKEIEQKASEYEVKPQDAKIDKVWKKMPGLNGLKVNLDKSYLNMEKQGEFDENKLVFSETQPEVKFEDLPAAPVYRGHPEKNMVSFLINVSWGEEYIPSMMKILKKHNIKATFFIDGKWAQENVDLLKMIDEEGHEIGSHGYNHPDMSQMNSSQLTSQVTKTNGIINSIIKKEPKLLAPPAGSFNANVVDIADQHDMETIMWTIDTIDWKDPSPSDVMNRVVPKLEGGSMILMHPTEVMEDTLEELILKIKEKNYKIGTVGNLLTENRS
ncbi:probable sporulation protein, polysaccharide deacetylase family [Salinibacillus kushneri]|uniref:Probable sporulation protein, polysaccharide deacetylase family n=1 Tax=Salinibacillus kushneri TaxID=237682 RepID=A0A1I0E4V4_9BACI|nr:polysaccharide deacetylase family protein [Salinibacillus kushneri]SET40177.1 probable sporulation protein, polysaccharide deacetylase family [Salinibacillus kushneri]